MKAIVFYLTTSPTFIEDVQRVCDDLIRFKYMIPYEIKSDEDAGEKLILEAKELLEIYYCKYPIIIHGNYLGRILESVSMLDYICNRNNEACATGG
jgi:hypothetical protein